MQRPLLFVVVMLSATMFVLVNPSQGAAMAAEQTQPTKKSKTKVEATAAPSKLAMSKFHTAETAGKAKACFGTAPQIEKVSPDEGKAGDNVTITGSQLGSADCLRSVSFGPGHTAMFTMKNDTTITATVPAGGRKGLALLTVTTASGEDSKSFLVK